MAVTINTNLAAIGAARNLSDNSSKLQKSLARLSSGRRIISPGDDAGGLAVSMKLSATINRTKSVISNIQNAASFGEVQDGALQAAARIVDRMAELKSLSLDVMKSSGDKENYSTEFKAMQQQLYQIGAETFNGVSLFATTQTGAGTGLVFGDSNNVVSIFTSAQGGSGSIVSMNKSLLLSSVTFKTASDMSEVEFGKTGSKSLAAAGSSTAIELSELSIGFLTQALENIATLRAENGATMVRLQFSEDSMRLSKANLEAANSRIMDVDVAEESTQLAKYNILAQASAAMLAQANQSASTALLLLG